MDFIKSTMIKICFSLIYKSLVTVFGLTTAILLITFLVTPAQANSDTSAEFPELNQIENKNSVKQGQLLFKAERNYSLAPLLKTDVTFSVTGMISRVTVEQEFENITDEWQEGIYVFPLPEDAAVDSLKMTIGERIIEGQIKERKQAKQIYQQAKKAGKKASLVEQERPNIFTNSVANIGPGEKITITIEYQETIKYDSGQFSFRFPMVVAPRYIPGDFAVSGFSGSGLAINTNEVTDAARITPPVMQPKHGDINPVSISVSLSTGFKLEQIHSPYHPIKINEEADHQYHISLQDNVTPANRDFELVWKPVLEQTINAAMFSESFEGDDYGLLMLLPNIQNTNQTLQREMIFVIDTSGSMAGESIKQAKSALLSALARLRKGDRFNIIQFNSYTSSLFNTPREFTPINLRKAKTYIKSLSADGGTEMLNAMQVALTQHNRNYQLRQLIFMTDGSIGNEDALFQLIKKQLDDTRLFPVGIGSAPNSYFMKRAARYGRGTFTYIGKTTEVEEKMSLLFDKIETPVLTDIKLLWENSESSSADIETWPQMIPELYKGEPLLVTFRSQDLPESLTVSGLTVDQNWIQKIPLIGGQSHNGIAKLWARQKISSLMEQRLNGNEQQAIEKTITDVALKYHLVSKFTSLVAVDVTPSRIKQNQLNTHAMPTNLAKGMQYDKVFGPMPQTATPALLHLLVGLLFILMYFPLKKLTQYTH